MSEVRPSENLCVLPYGSCLKVARKDVTQMNQPALVEILALQYDFCARCNATLDSLQKILSSSSSQWKLQVHQVASREDALKWRLKSSPTLRVNGNDLPLPLSESACGDCSQGDVSVVCRSWIWNNQEHAVPPQEMLESLLAQAAQLPPAKSPNEPFQLPDNLERYFSSQGAGCCSPQTCDCRS